MKNNITAEIKLGKAERILARFFPMRRIIAGAIATPINTPTISEIADKLNKSGRPNAYSKK